MLDKIKDIKVGGHYTIVLFHSFGYPHQMHIVVNKIMMEKFKDPDDTCAISYMKLDTGYKSTFKLHKGCQFLLWEGIVHPNTDVAVCIYIKDSDHGHVKLLKRWRDRDPRYMVRAKLSVDNLPLVENIHKPLREQLLDFCTVIS